MTPPPPCVCAVPRVVKESLTPLNFTIVLQTVVDLLERSCPDPKNKGERPGHPQHIPDLLLLLHSSGGGAAMGGGGHPRHVPDLLCCCCTHRVGEQGGLQWGEGVVSGG